MATHNEKPAKFKSNNLQCSLSANNQHFEGILWDIDTDISLIQVQVDKNLSSGLNVLFEIMLNSNEKIEGTGKVSQVLDDPLKANQLQMIVKYNQMTSESIEKINSELALIQDKVRSVFKDYGF